MPGVEKYILKVKKKLTSNDLEEKKILKYLRHLDQLEVNVDILKNTGIGKIVNGMKKHEGIVSDVASNLVTKWKNIVINNTNTEITKQSVQKPSHSLLPPTAKLGRSSLLNSEIEFEPSSEQRNRGNGRNEREEEESKGQKQGKDNNIKTKETKNADFIVEHLGQLIIGTKVPSLQLCDISFGCEITKEMSKRKKKRQNPTTSTPSSSYSSPSSTRENSSYHHNNQELSDYTSPYLPPLPTVASVNEALLPDIQPTYKPSRLPLFDDSSPLKKKGGDIERTFVGEIKSKKSKTQVFSGRKNPASCGIVASLFDSCIRVLIEHIDALHDTGGVPYDILHPVLCKCNPQQLLHLEDCNPHFIEESDELWQAHYRREFKCEKKVDGVSWRDSYLQKCREREEKLEKINAKISAAQAAKKPERQVKLAYVMTEAKPPPQIRRKQARYGTGQSVEIPVISPVKSSSAPKSSNSSKFSHISQSSSSVPAAPTRRPAQAPMMKKTMKLVKNQRSIAGAQIRRR